MGDSTFCSIPLLSSRACITEAQRYRGSCEGYMITRTLHTVALDYSGSDRFSDAKFSMTVWYTGERMENVTY
jgi:hypothetical protein